MKAVQATWRTLAATSSVLRRHPSAGGLPFIAFLLLLLATFTLIVPLFQRVLGPQEHSLASRALLFLSAYVAYAVLFLLTSFADVAMVRSIAARLDGERSAFAKGYERAMQRFGQIATHTLASATLGVLNLMARILVHPFFGSVIAPALGKGAWERWRSLSYGIGLQMAIPVIALEDPTPSNAFEHGARLVERTWGEHTKPAHDVGLLSPLVLVPLTVFLTLPTLRKGLAAQDPATLQLGLVSTLLVIGVWLQVNALVNAIVALAAHRFATSGRSDVVPGDPSYAEQAFVRSHERKPHHARG